MYFVSDTNILKPKYKLFAYGQTGSATQQIEESKEILKIFIMQMRNKNEMMQLIIH